MRLSFLLLFLCLSLHAQKETNIWHFGVGGALDFNTSPPTVLNVTSIGTFGAASSICDTSGALLFYSDGQVAYARNHNAMPNGNHLGSGFNVYGDYNVLAAPWPDSSSLYYIFSIEEDRPYRHRLQFAVVDMRRNGGLGDVVSKNNPVYDSSESVVGVFHQNGKDLWIIEHGRDNKTFRVHAVTARGFNTSPQVQPVSTASTRFGSSMRVSHDGKRLALVNYLFIELFDFDKATGELKQRLRIDGQDRRRTFQSAEFSPNGRFMYLLMSNWRERLVYLYRYDLTASDITASRELIVKEAGMVDLLLASDQRIYVGYERLKRYLSKITNPNSLSKVNFVSRALNLFGYTAIYLPNLVRGYVPNITMSDFCEDKPIDFKLNSRYTINKTIWDFGDGTPKLDQLNPRHRYTKPGAYDLSVEYTYTDGRTFTLEENIEIDTLDVKLPVPSKVCTTSLPFDLNGSPKGGIYKGTGIDFKMNIFSPAVAGVGTFPITYTYASRYGCRDSITQNITVQNPQVLTLSPSVDTFCLNDPVVNLNRIAPAGGTYRGKGVASNRFAPLAAGIGTHTISYVLNNACRSMRTFSLTVTAQGRQLQFSKTISKDICGYTNITFTNTSPAGTRGFIWRAGDGSAPVKTRDFAHTYTKAGSYTVRLEADCGKTASELVIIPSSGNFRFQSDTTVCTGDSIRLEVGGADKYTWKPTSNLDNPDIANPLVFPTATTDYVVKMEKASCVIYDTVRVTVLPKVKLDFKAELVNGCDSLQTVVLSNNALADLTFTWQDEAGNQLTRINQATIQSTKLRRFWVYLKSGLRSCAKQDSVFFEIGHNPDYLPLSATSVKASSSTNCGMTESIQLEAAGGSSYLWQPALGLSNSKIPNPTATPTTSTTYTVKITNAAGCAVQRSIKVEVLTVPKIKFVIEQERAGCNQVSEVHFKNETVAAEYQWDFGDGQTSKAQAPVHRYAEGGKYEVKLRAVNANTCFIDTTFEVRVEEALIYNAFSPNGDGYNEVLDFGLAGWAVEIYNRWGKLVYESSDYKNDWSGGDLTAGTYYYILRSPKGYNCRGWVALLK